MRAQWCGWHGSGSRLLGLSVLTLCKAKALSRALCWSARLGALCTWSALSPCLVSLLSASRPQNVHARQAGQFFVLVLLALESLAGGAAADILTATLSNVTFTDRQTGNIASLTGILYFEAGSADLVGWSATFSAPWLSVTAPINVGVNDSTRTLLILDSYRGICQPSGCDVRVYLNISAPPASPGNYPLTGGSFDLRVDPVHGGGGNLRSGSLTVTSGVKSLGQSCDVPGSVECGHPITIGVGNVFEQVTDYATSGQNKLSFTRY